ncbi:unnamed protein product [Durusdinium trenchii]|uniref:Uncharacterized protein n=1 Tax=Durusdinium trenchii TaxID=1381693 RepID=A0ABP0QSB5_9DINO
MLVSSLTFVRSLGAVDKNGRWYIFVPGWAGSELLVSPNVRAVIDQMLQIHLSPLKSKCRLYKSTCRRLLTFCDGRQTSSKLLHFGPWGGLFARGLKAQKFKRPNML